MQPLVGATLALLVVAAAPYVAFVALYAWRRPAGSAPGGRRPAYSATNAT